MSPKLLNILLVLIPIVMYYGFFQPMYTGNPGMIWTPESSIVALQSTNVQYLNAINLVSYVEREIKRVNNDYKAIPLATSTLVQVMLPDAIDPIKLRNEVVSIANMAEVGIIGISVSPDGKNNVPGTGSYLVSFSVKGRYQALKKLFEEFEKNRRFYNVETLTINRNDPKGLSPEELLVFDKDSLSANITYKVYYLK